MATALFSDLAPLLTSLRTGLEDPSRDPLTVRPTVQALAARLTAARTLYVAEGVRARPLAATEADVRRFLSRSSILITAGVLVTTLTRNLIWGGPQASSAWVLLIFPLLWWSLGRWPDRFTPARVNGVLLLAAYIAAGRAFLSWGHSATSPNLPLMPALMFMAGMLNGPAVVAGTFLGCGGMLAWAGLSSPVTPDQLRLLTNLSLLLVLMALMAFSVVQLRQAFLGQLRQQAEAVREALQLRRRLAGTLFHDVSNQLAALTGTLELAVIEQAEPAATRSAARRFCARIDGLVGVSRDFLMGDGQLDPGQLRPMAVPTLFRDIEDLFRGRLKAKRQTLMMLGEGGLRVLGLPEIITESVLGNLMSNAIKFSPLGAIIELEAQREGDGVALLVRDAGPGIPQALIDALAADGPLPSSPGSAGEAGQGYGLKLVREHLQRLGGRLDLRRHPDGGTVAVAWLKAA